MEPLLAALSPVEILQAAVLVLAALFPVVNPLGGAPIAPILAEILGSLSMASLIWVLYGSAERIGPVLGPSGTSVVVRLSAFILLCIGVQITWNGLSALAGPLLKQ